MRNKVLATAVMGAWLFMGAQCSTSSDVLGIISQVQAAAASACGFVPTVETILDITKLNNELLKNATDIAHAICDAVNKAPQAKKAGKPADTGATVNGVVVRGYVVG
jgi:hypothetical protein